jgi:hypothetical protein
MQDLTVLSLLTKLFAIFKINEDNK